MSEEQPKKEPLTVEILKKLPFSMVHHINGGDKYSERVDANLDWRIAIATETSGSPKYTITSKTLYAMDNHEVHLDMQEKPCDFESFVAAYNASERKEVAS